MRSVGVMGDERTYDYAVALRAVTTVDFMTAEAAEIPYDVLNKVMSRIINEVKGVNRVFYDLTSKPPGTIEFEQLKLSCKAFVYKGFTAFPLQDCIFIALFFFNCSVIDCCMLIAGIISNAFSSRLYL